MPTYSRGGVPLKFEYTVTPIYSYSTNFGGMMAKIWHSVTPFAVTPP